MSARLLCTTLVVFGFVPLLPTAAVAQEDHPGALVAAEYCVDCHGGDESERAPDPFMLAAMSPRAIVAALVDGPMRAEGAELSQEERIAVAEYIARRSYTETSMPESGFCSDAGAGPLDMGAVSWMGFGGNLEGTGFQGAARAGLTAADVPELELQWAFAFPDAYEARSKPTVIGDVVLVGSQLGEVIALDASSGCVRWVFEADSGIRGAVLVDEVDGRSVAYFMDFRTNAYALDVAEGSVLWKTLVGWHPASSNTGSPVLHDGKLIVPISSMEVVVAGNPEYECCTASGAVAALDQRTGDVVWYHRVIEDNPVEAGTNPAGTQLWAPSGAPVWSSPTVDAERGLVYVGTGESYTRPASPASDAILAVDVETGELVWSFQATAEDAFNMACTTPTNRENCPAPPGPDVDFGMAPMLVTTEDGADVLIAGQKSGTVWALDPDAEGRVLWSTTVGKGGALGGIHWGMASDGSLAYAANSDRGAVIVDVHPDQEPAPGLFALDVLSGDVVWSALAPEGACGDTPGCFAANSAAPTVIEGVVFAGGLDGVIRAHSTEDGTVLWQYDTVREFETANGVPGRGGAIDGPGPVVADGRLFVNSGYGTFGQMPGNVLLAFGVANR